MKIEIRLATPDDASAIASVLRRSFAEYEPRYTPEGFAATTPGAAAILDRMSEGPVWVAVLNGIIAGTASVVPRDTGLYLRGMAVLPEARGQSTGSLMLKKIEAYAAEHGYSRIFLSTTPFLARAIQLYEHAGFVRCSDGPSDLFGTPLFTMEKRLGEIVSSSSEQEPSGLW